MRIFWFTPQNEAQLEDADFLESMGIKFRAPRGRVTFYRDPDTEKMVGVVGKVFVLQDGRIIIHPCVDASDRARRTLLRTALDCAERDEHLRMPGWTYRRKTTKRQGYWVTRVLVAVDPQASMARELVAMQDLLSSPDIDSMPEHELAPEIREVR